MDKIALVTGGAAGIGLEISRHLLHKGIKVYIGDVSEKALNTASEELKSFGNFAGIVCFNVSAFADTTRAIDEILQKEGVIHILINNAGITRDNLLLRMPECDWDSVLSVNLKGVFNCTKAVLRPLLKARWGRIVNISSVIGIMGNAGQANYAASKAGIIGFTKSIAREVASRGVTVNAIAPGFIKTSMTDALTKEIQDQYLASIPLGRFGLPEDIAKTVLFLISDDASYITGQVIHIDGGLVM
ncbi:MAG: 3-oxoacyl-[acyl-carrier-protein] reductase [Candidatus Coatesbacteria bacterium]|nr:3-oxoacyl-[acyl-carrier-protein] reductase [Candidatus Coatesbacteria bacterium]